MNIKIHEIDNAIEAATNYLLNSVKKNRQFVYLNHIDFTNPPRNRK